MSTLIRQAPQIRQTLRRRRAPRGRSSKNVLTPPVKVAASTDASEHEVDHEASLFPQKDATWTQGDKQNLNGYNLITVEEFEKCLRNTNESVATIGFKNNSQVDMERYLNEQLSEVLFGRDILAADVDMDSAARSLSVDYDSGYNESHNLYFSKEDEYILSEFQLDGLDKLDYCTDEINLIGDFSSSNGTLLPRNISNVNTKDLIIRLQETINKFNDSDKNIDNTQVQNKNYVSEYFENSSLTSLQDLTLENTSYNDLSISNQNKSVDYEFSELPSSSQIQTNYSVKKRAVNKNNLNSTDKSKYQSIIVTRRRALLIKEQNVTNSKENTIEKAKKISESESSRNDQHENFKLRPYSYLNPQEIAIAKALFELGIKDSMLKHMYTPDKIKIWVCHMEDCERHFSKLCYLKTHLLQHYGVKPFKCDYKGCSWAFYEDVKLKRHKETHLKKKNFVCTIPGCNRKFTTIYNLAIHEKRHSTPNKLCCQVSGCTEECQNKHDFELHMMSHGSEPQYICNFDGCGRRFYTNNTLVAHRRCHSHSDSEITCSWPGCGKTFDHPCRLKTHMRFHTGSKPYACTFKGCKWSFCTASKLKRHQTKHTNDRKFTCDVENCNKTFMRLDHLKDHKLRHSVELFQCHSCSSFYPNKKELYAHFKKHGKKESHVSRKTVEKPAEKRKTTRKKKEFVCSALQPLRLTIKRVCKKSSVDKAQTEKAVAVQSSIRKSARINKKNVSAVLAFSNYENKEDSQMEQNPPLTEIQNVTHLIPSSLISEEELPVICTPQGLANSQVVSTQNQADPVTQNENLDFVVLSISEKNVAGNVGSARTALTRVDILSLKPNRGGSNSNEKESDIVLDVANIGDSLMLSEDLMPFACQDDTGIMYQIPLLNTETENEISIQD